MKGCENMGCPDIYYERFVREADRLLAYSWNTDEVKPLKDIEQRISGYKHNSDFYFNCGIAAANVLYSVKEEEGGDAFNAALGGLSEFESLIGNDSENVINVYDKQIKNQAKELKMYIDDYRHRHLVSANCPNCNKVLGVAYDYCPSCGQHLDWDIKGKILCTKENGMELKEIIEILRSLQNPMEDYAEIIGAPSPDMYGEKYVFPDPEDYAIEEAIEALEKMDKYRWHDLRENPDDLPEEHHNYEHSFSDKVLVITEEYKNTIVAYMNLTLNIWLNPIHEEYLEPDFGKVIAWKYIEPFEKSVSTEENI